MSRLVIVSGPPGAGKSTVARRLARQAVGPLAMHIHTDDIYTYVQKGFVFPWLPEAMEQNITLMNAMAAQAAICVRGGYEVVIDGIVGGWFLDPWRDAAREHGMDVRYIVLLPAVETAVARATGRDTPGAMKDPAVVHQMWQAFHDFPVPPGHVLDTTGQGAAETVAAVREGLEAGGFRLA